MHPCQTKPIAPRPRGRTRGIVVALLLSVLPSATHAQISWNGGGGDNNWGTGANWVGGSSPTPGTSSDIAFAGTTRTNPFNNYTAYDDFRNVFFASGAGTFGITGNPIDLFGKIENNSANTQAFALTIGTGSASGSYIEINPVAGNLNINSADIFLGNNQLRVYGNNGNTLTFGTGTTISGSGGSVAINQNSTVIYQSAHTYTGGTFINAGVLRFNSGGSADSSAITLGDTTGSAASALQVASGVTLGGGALTVRSGSSGASTLGYTEASGTGTVSRNITLSNNLALNVASGGTLLLSGTVSMPANLATVRLSVDGGGIVVSTGNSTSANATNYQVRIGDGTLVIGAGTLISRTSVAGVGHAVDLGVDLNDSIVDAASTLRASNGVTISNSIYVSTTNNRARVIGASGADAATTYSGPIGLNAAALTIDASNSQTATVSGAITNVSGTGSLIKTGGGTATLTGANTFTGSTTINGGTLSINADTRLGTAPGSATPGHLTFDGGTLRTTASFTLGANRGTALGTGGGTIEVTNGTTLTYDGIIAGGGSLTKTGDGELRIGGVNTYTGLTTVSAGTLRVTNASGLGATSAGTTVASGATVYFAAAGNYAAEPITINGTGVGGTTGALRLLISATNNGLITLASDSTIKADGGVITGGITNTSGTQNLTVEVATGNTYITNTGIGLGSGDLTKTGSTGILHVYTSNNYTGATTVNAGTLRIYDDNALGSTSGTTTVASGGNVVISGTRTVAESFFINGPGNSQGGALHGSAGSSILTGLVTLQSDATISVANAYTLTNSGGITGNNVNLTFNASASGSNIGTNRVVSSITLGTGGVTKTGDGILLLAGTNTYTGTTTVQGGTLILSNGSAIADAAAVLLDNTAGVNLVVTNSETIGSLRGGGATGGSVSLAPNQTLTVAETGSQTFAGVISNSGNLTKSAAGTLTLSGANTYTGTTAISGGTLRISANNNLGASTNVTLTGGSVLEMTATGTLTNRITIGTGNGVLSNSSGGAVTYSGPVSKDGTTLTSRSGTGTNVFTGVISGANANSDLVVDGGTTVFSNQMTYTGPTIITNSGTLVLKVDDAMPSGGSLVLGGGTFLVGDSTAVYGDTTIGTMTLSANSTIDFGTSTDTTTRSIGFANSSAISWTGTLKITNWTQATNSESGAYGRLYFSNNTNGLTTNQLSQISFDIGGTLYGAKYLSDGEVVADLTPIPEAPVTAAAAVIVLAILWKEHRRLRSLLNHQRPPRN